MTTLSDLYSNTILFSLGAGDNLGKAKNTSETIRKFVDRFRKPHVTPEKYREYKAMNDQRQRTLKGIAGWMMRGSIKKGENRNRNSIQPSKLMTLDIDYATPEFVEMLLAGKILPGAAFIAHSTRSHTPEKPRLRIIIFLKDAVSRDRYQAASRITAQAADPEMQWVDKVSFRPAQMMYMPTVSKDMEKHYVFYEQGGELWDHEDAIEQWELLNDSATDIANLPRTPGEDELREAADFAEDPLDKKGPVGDFCRAYSITDLVEGKDGEPGILAHLYTATEWHNGAITRMTWLGGGSSNGAVVYDDKFVYSHHGTDPTADKLVNAYDLVRIHLFEKFDEKADSDTAMKDLPSTKKMTEFLSDNKHFRIAQTESRYNIEDMLSDDDVDYDAGSERDIDEGELSEMDDLLGTPVASIAAPRLRKSHRRNLAEKPPKNWIASQLSLTADGKIENNSWNIGMILMNDPRLWRKIGRNEFNYQIAMVDDVKSKMELLVPYECKDKDNGDRWQDHFDNLCRTLLEAPTDKGGYGMSVPMEKVRQQIDNVARRNSFHPVQERILDHAENGEPGFDIERVFLDYFGAKEDNAYTRQASRLFMIASVARVFEPGCKFDFAVIFEGKQGLGKSTAIKRLYGQEYFGELETDLGNKKETAEHMMGKWALELPELSALTKGKADANSTKSFMSRQHDDVRLSYEKHMAQLPRQCVIYGTTNNKEYLSDPTGNRRFWPMPVKDEPIDSIAIMRAKASIWRAAYEAYVEMRSNTHTSLDLPLFLTGEAAEIGLRMQEGARKEGTAENWAKQAVEWADEKMTLQSFISVSNLGDGLEQRYKGYDVDNTLVCRVGVAQKELFREVLGVNKNTSISQQEQNLYLEYLEHMQRLGWVKSRNLIGGVQAVRMIRPDLTRNEKYEGFRVVGSADAPESATPQVDDDEGYGDNNDLL